MTEKRFLLKDWVTAEDLEAEREVLRKVRFVKVPAWKRWLRLFGFLNP